MLLSLHDLTNVNTVLGMLYDENGVYRAAFEPGVFYNTILLDTLKYGEENYVHLKYAETINIRRGETVARFRRWAGLTPTLRPLKEGVPPAPDKHAYETIEVGNVFSFGRWSEYTDRVDLSIISEVIAERSLQYGEVANQTKELYARKTWLAAPNDFYANFKDGFADLMFGDEVTLDDLRFLTQRMKRMLVKPIGGKFNYVCSDEFLNGLIDDPRVKQYMEINNTTGNLWGSGEPFDMFGLSFIPTMLDEFAYPDTEFPGVYEDATGKEIIRLYAVEGQNIFYLDVHQDFLIDGTTVTAKKLFGTDGSGYLSDGTAVEDHYVWDIPKTTVALDATNSQLKATADATSAKVSISTYKKAVTYNADYSPKTTYTYDVGSGLGYADLAALFAKVNTLIDNGEFMQLPVHRGILFGMEALVKLAVDGVSDQPQIIVKELGSSGVADPINQRQSVGFKVDGFGLAIKRPEAICVTYGIPKFAEFAALTDKFMTGEWQDMDGLKASTSGYDNIVSADALGNYGVLQVSGVNESVEPDFSTSVNGLDASGDPVTYDNTLEENVLDNGGNDPDSNTK